MAKGEGPYYQCGPGKHPFVHREERIFLYQRLEEREVEGKRQLCRHAEQIALDVAHLGVAGRGAGRYYDYRASASKEHATRLLPCYGLFQDEE